MSAGAAIGGGARTVDPSRRGRDLAAITIAIACVPIAWSAVAGPHLFDAGELVAAGAQLGAGHPPGQPLHALLAHAATLVPLGPIAWRIALLSVVCGALAAYAAAGIVADAIARRGDGGDRAPAASAGTRRVDVVIPAAVALAVLFAPAVAPQIARPEVYSLALALTLGGARALVAWACRDDGAARSLRVAALAAGLTVAVHPPHALALLSIGLVLLLAWRRDVLRRPRALAWSAAACIVGIAVVVYLPTRAAAGAAMWGEPTTLGGLLAYLSGSAYAGNLGIGGGSLAAQVLEVVAYVLVPAGLGAVLAIAATAARWGEREERRRLAIVGAAAGAALVGACLQPLERANPDNVAYAAPAMALAFVLGGTALTLRRVRPWAAGAGAAALMIAPLPFTDLGAALRADLPQLEPLAFAIVDVPPPRALVVARSDFTAAAWLQARAVDGARPDVALLIEGLSTSSWHWRTLGDHPLFDGTPVRSARGGAGYAPWVAGAIERAVGRVGVLAEGDDAVAGRGTVAGPYLWVDPAVGTQARAERAFGERTFGASGRMLSSAPRSFGGLGDGVVREAEIARARRLFVRDQAPLAIAALRRASAPLGADATRDAEDVSGSPRRPAPPAVRDGDAIFATSEDAVRELAMVLVALGEPGRAARMLDAQQGRGDDRALLQLAWMQASDGLLGPARAALDAYRARHPDREGEIAPLAARLR